MLFASLATPANQKLDEAATALQRTGHVAFRVDTSGVFLVLTACADHEVDFVAAVPDGDGWLPAPMTLAEQERLHTWAAEVVPRLCKRWRARYPHSNVGRA
jgi:hypothetical protein